MWARHMELALGLWLVLGPWIFRLEGPGASGWWNHVVCGTLVSVLALLACWPPARRAHLLQLPVAAWLMGSAWWVTWHAPHELPAQQDLLVVGFLLAMLAIVPGQASRPPEAWERWEQDPRPARP